MERRLDDITLKEYIESELDNLDKSIKKSEGLLELRLEGMNQFRNQIECERTNYLTKEVYETRHKALEDKLNYLEKLFYIGLGVILTLEVIFRVLK